MDDLLDSCETIKDAKDLQKQVTNLLGSKDSNSENGLASNSVE